MGSVRKPVRRTGKDRERQHEKLKEEESALKEREAREIKERGNTDYRRSDEI